MQVVGADKLADFLNRPDAAAGALRAFHAIATHAEWKSPDDVRRHFGPAARFVDPGGVHVVLPSYGLRLELQVNYAIGLVRIAAIEVGDPHPTANGEAR